MMINALILYWFYYLHILKLNAGLDKEGLLCL